MVLEVLGRLLVGEGGLEGKGRREGEELAARIRGAMR
jgi:hypothetical protein